jgi:hypothetical protein
MLVRHTITITKLKPFSVDFFVYYIIPSFTCFGPWPSSEGQLTSTCKDTLYNAGPYLLVLNLKLHINYKYALVCCGVLCVCVANILDLLKLI